MPIRNPFARRQGFGAVTTDENAYPGDGQDPSHPGFERQDTVGSKNSSALSIRSSRSQDAGEYKMSVVNDSGVYLPPSPTEEKRLWPKTFLPSGRTSTDTRHSGVGEIEPFSISRESFDSYRRSFDVSARSPVTNHDVLPRQSLDSARFPRFPRTTFHRSTVGEQPTVEESGFEEVGLHDEQGSKQQQQQQQHPSPNPQAQTQTQRRRGLFARFGDSGGHGHDNRDQPPATPTTGNPVSRFLMTGRKRAQSGQGSELGTMERPHTAEADGQEVR
ncbi:hypothetical protein SODALDRAFT_328944 [Sodiomyces alkalinus F11]|uniref:Uncharacterized protein n=1 Tax=Sodiomyces alkalinus (strain CBS 110278 / VKM F-3762 / F11) TaxID=1314773 RepID=A0A3N2PM76_SODAK|nr:hypothetical protein SODALDRAFT_328944 [Sodiomyces alkalinus F11]ROT35579.1 hypothetical protein SODALDRAFT_328944 [Sodiomyces alkalinus F11]